MVVVRLSVRAGLLLAVVVLVAPVVLGLAQAQASPAEVCGQLGGTWNNGEQFCGKVATNPNQSKTVLEARFPADLVEGGVSGPTLQKFIKGFFVRFAKVTDDPRATDGGATLRYRLSEHQPTLKSVLFSNIWYAGNAKYPVEELTSFTFDSNKGRALVLSDLFQPGSNPLPQIAQPARETIQSQLDPVNAIRSRENLPPLRAQDFDPGKALNPNNYPVFTVGSDELVLYLPQTRSGEPGSAMIEAHIPLTTLKNLLRPEYR